MPRLALTGGAYQARSVIASAQRSLNLFAEPMPQDQGEPGQAAHYPTPGLTLLGALPQNIVRGIKQTTTGGIYAVAGQGIYHIAGNDWTSNTLLGTIPNLRTTPVSMQDNGNTLVIVDGSANIGWTVDLASNAFGTISDPAFYGADRVDYLDTYLLFNKPGTPQFYSSDSLATTFDPLWFANKESFSDLLVTLVVARREIWLIGERTTEIWFNNGSPDFPFQQQAGVFVDHGCAAKYSVCTYDDTVYWLSYDRAGQGIVLSGAGYQTKRLSTWAIENELTKYSTISDAIGMIYSQAGHVFYVLTFPAADHTWVYDITTRLWHEWLWIDSNGVEHRHRANCMYFVGGQVVCGDWENGNLYAVDAARFTDNGNPIKRVRSYPHVLNDGKRVYYRQFIADLETGNPGSDADAHVDTIISTSFVATDGTALGSFSNSGDIGATFTLKSGGGAVIDHNVLTGIGGGSTALYEVAGVPEQADYDVQFRATPSSYSPMPPASSLFVIGRSSSEDATTGYQSRISNDSTQFYTTLTVLGTTTEVQMPLGTLANGFYTVTLGMLGSRITHTVYRSEDGLWLAPSGLWMDVEQPAIVLDDATYMAPGRILIGGSWNA